MPEAYLAKLAAQNSISYNHLLATLEGKMKWRGVDVDPDGPGPGGVPAGTAEAGDDVQVEPGTAYVGHRIADGARECRRATSST